MRIRHTVVAACAALTTAAAPVLAQPGVPPGVETPSNYARAELVTLETLNGALIGSYICVLAECESARPWVGALMGGTAAGLGLSLLLTTDGITSGEGQLVESGTFWGAWNGLALAGVFDLYDDTSEKPAFGALLAGQLGGTLVGAGLTRLIKPSGGQVSLAGSVGVWLGVETALVMGATDSEIDSQTVWGALLAATDVGLLAGAYVADRYPMSRGRNLLINVGGAVGGLGGAGLAVLIGGDVSTGVGFSSMIVGSLTGLVVTTLLTRHWDADGPAAQIAVTPTKGGALGSLSMTF